MRLFNQRGLVSLPAVTIASLMFLILTLAMTKMMVGELNSAVDSEDSIKAMFAAESASEEYILTVKNGLAAGTSVALSSLNRDCTASPLTVPNASNREAITCASFQASGTGDTGDIAVAQDASKSFVLPSSVTSVTLSWDEQFSTGNPQTPPPANAIASTTDPTSWNGPPELDVYSSAFTSGNPFASSANNFALLPQTATPGSAFPLLPGALGVYTVTCQSVSTTSSYRCQIVIAGINSGANQRTVIRISPRHRAAEIRLVANSGGTILPESSPLDITAKVGNSYRRVVQSINLRTGLGSIGNVIQGDDQVCKQVKEFDEGGGAISVPPDSLSTCN